MGDKKPWMASPARPPFWVAHTPSRQNPDWHPLVDHVLAVTGKASEFALAFGPAEAEWARYLGLLHDLGKFTDAFQRYLWDCFAAERDGTPAPKPGSAPHKQAGAVAA